MTSKRQVCFLAGCARVVGRAAIGFAMMLLAVGCATSSRIPVEAAPLPSVPVEESIEPAVALDAEAVVRPKPRFRQKLNPVWWLGNVDDPIPPDWYRPGKRFRKARWSLRNPFHNFTFYVIGVADKDFTRSGTHPGHVFNPEGGWTRAVSRTRWRRLPFVSYIRNDFKCYAGWRERGNFGLKLTF